MNNRLELLASKQSGSDLKAAIGRCSELQMLEAT
jgi:hypothetical protein